MTSSRGLREVLDAVAARMLADFQASGLLEHRGSKGAVRETGLRAEFLSKYLPRTVSVVGSGEVIAVNGEVSGQCDVLVVDPATPPLWDSDDYRVVPAECLDAVVEVKSNLTAAELRSAWRSIRAVKALPKTAFRPQGIIEYTTSLYGREFAYWPTLGFIFAYDSATLDSLGAEFAALAGSESDAALRVNAVFVLNRGCLLWQNALTGQYAAHGDSDALVVAVDAAPGEVLMQMLAHLNTLLSQANHRIFDPLPYLQGGLGTVSGRWAALPVKGSPADGGGASATET